MDNIRNEDVKKEFDKRFLSILRKKVSEDITPQFYLTDFLPIPVGLPTMIYSAGGAGKTQLALQLCIRYILETNQVAFYWLGELNERLIVERSTEVYKLLNLSNEQIEKVDNKLIISVDADINKSKLKDYLQEIAFRQVKFIVIDPLSNFFAGIGKNENDNTQAQQFMSKIQSFSVKNNCAFIIIHHNRKTQLIDNKNKYSNKEEFNLIARGASAFTNSVGICYGVQSSIPYDVYCLNEYYKAQKKVWQCWKRVFVFKTNVNVEKYFTEKNKDEFFYKDLHIWVGENEYELIKKTTKKVINDEWDIDIMENLYGDTNKDFINESNNSEDINIDIDINIDKKEQ